MKANSSFLHVITIFAILTCTVTIDLSADWPTPWKGVTHEIPLADFRDIAYNGAYYVAVGTDGIIARSVDGLSWEFHFAHSLSQNSQPALSFTSNILVWVEGRFVATALNGNKLVTASSTDGIAWSIDCIIGESEPQKWPYYRTRLVEHNGKLYVHGSESRRYHKAEAEKPATLYVSIDGLHWVETTFPGLPLNGDYRLLSAGTYLLAYKWPSSSDLPIAQFYVSTDGIHWHSITLPEHLNPQEGSRISFAFDGEFYALTTHKSIVVFDGNLNQLNSAPIHSSLGDNKYWHIQCGKGNPGLPHVMVANADFGPDFKHYYCRFAYAHDWQNWTPLQTVWGHLHSLRYLDHAYYAVGELGQILRSTDGVNWVHVLGGATTDHVIWQNAVTDGNHIVIVGSWAHPKDYNEVSSFDPRAWWKEDYIMTLDNRGTVVNLLVNRHEDVQNSEGLRWWWLNELLEFDSLTYGNGIYLAASKHALYRSEDAIHWETITPKLEIDVRFFPDWPGLETEVFIGQVHYVDGRFIATGRSFVPTAFWDRILLSWDGREWLDLNKVEPGQGLRQSSSSHWDTSTWRLINTDDGAITIHHQRLDRDELELITHAMPILKKYSARKAGFVCRYQRGWAMSMIGEVSSGWFESRRFTSPANRETLLVYTEDGTNWHIFRYHRELYLRSWNDDGMIFLGIKDDYSAFMAYRLGEGGRLAPLSTGSASVQTMFYPLNDNGLLSFSQGIFLLEGHSVSWSEHAQILPLDESQEEMICWLKSDVFGYYYVRHYPWIYSHNHGWLYVADPTHNNSVSHSWVDRFIYDTRLGWLYFHWHTYPYLYSFKAGIWLWFDVQSAVPARRFMLLGGVDQSQVVEESYLHIME